MVTSLPAPRGTMSLYSLRHTCGPSRSTLRKYHSLLLLVANCARSAARLAAAAALLFGALSSPATAPDPIPVAYGDLVNRVFLRTAPNGYQLAIRLLPANTFEPISGYQTNRADFTREGLEANQGRLVLASTDRFGGVYAWQTNQFVLTFASPTNGTYALEFTTQSVPGVQRSEGPFSLSLGNNLPPVIQQEPSGGAFIVGGNISALSVGALGFDLQYQWYRNGVAVPDATRSALAFLPLKPEHLGDWYVVVSNRLGSVTSTTVRIEEATLPVITLQPRRARGLEAGSATFAVSATGGGLNYQWLFNGRAAGYPNQPTLTLTNLSLVLAGQYSVEVANNAGRTTSLPARLEVCSPGLNAVYHDRPWARILGTGDAMPGTANTFGPLRAPFEPLFTLHDQELVLVARGDDDLAADGPIHRGLLQWREGALRTLVFTNTANPLGGNFSDVFYPTERGDGAINFASGSMFQWREDGITEILGPQTDVPGRNEKFFGPGSFARRGSRVVIAATFGQPGNPTFSGTGFYLRDGVALTRICDDSTDLPGVLTGYAFRGTEDSVNLDEQTLVFSTITGLNGTGGLFQSTPDGVITKLADSGDGYSGFGDIDVEGGTVFAIAGVKTGTTVVNRVLAFPPAGDSSVLGLGDYLVAAGPTDVYFGNASAIQRWRAGVLETVISTGALLDCKKVRRFFDVEAQGDDVTIGVEFQDGTVGVYANFGRPTEGAPRILAQPQDAITPESAPATFAVSASGPAPLEYQWRKDGQPISGATSASLTILGASLGDIANYDVVVTAGGGASSTISTAARLRLDPAPLLPAIYVQPQSAVVPVGSTAQLSVVASGAPPLTYQWRLGTNAVDGARERTFSPIAQSNAVYSVVIANMSGSVTSVLASVQPQPILAEVPQSLTVAPGASAAFTVVATGFPAYRYFWFKDNTALTGQTNATLLLENVQTSDAGAYSVTVIPTGGASLRTPAATLTVGNGGGGPSEIRLGQPSLVAGQIVFTVPTRAGKTYQVQRQTSLTGAEWSVRQSFPGDGTAKSVQVAAEGGGGFLRVAEQP